MYDETVVCELVGNYLRYELSKLFDKNGPGLYIDGGLVVFKNKSGLKSEKTEKSIQSIFQENELK